MFKHLLIATDGSDLAAKAVTTGLTLAKDLGARVATVTATEPWSAMVSGDDLPFTFPIAEYEKASAENAARILGAVQEEAGRLGLVCETVHVTDSPADAIIATAKARGCDLIVMASHGRRGVARLLLGSQASKVVTLSPVPVLICR
jgi:nucleotide-binding universal stress UspA family protein